MRPGPDFMFEDRDSFLSVRVVMMVVTMMVTAGGESRSGKHHQKQGSSEDLFHATNVAWTTRREKCIPCRASREARGWEAWSNMGSPLGIAITPELR
jgi:hypothetical protein